MADLYYYIQSGAACDRYKTTMNLITTVNHYLSSFLKVSGTLSRQTSYSTKMPVLLAKLQFKCVLTTVMKMYSCCLFLGSCTTIWGEPWNKVSTTMCIIKLTTPHLQVHTCPPLPVGFDHLQLTRSHQLCYQLSWRTPPLPLANSCHQFCCHTQHQF